MSFRQIPSTYTISRAKQSTVVNILLRLLSLMMPIVQYRTLVSTRNAIITMKTTWILGIVQELRMKPRP